MSYWHLLLQCTINLLIIPLAILNTLWYSVLSAVYTFYMVVGLHLYFLFERTYCDEDRRPPSQAIQFVTPKTRGHKLTQTMKHHACQFASGSTIKYNLGPQYSINIGCHHKILGTRKVKWSKFQYSEPTNIPNFITRQHPDLCVSTYS